MMVKANAAIKSVLFMAIQKLSTKCQQIKMTAGTGGQTSI